MGWLYYGRKERSAPPRPPIRALSAGSSLRGHTPGRAPPPGVGPLGSVRPVGLPVEEEEEEEEEEEGGLLVLRRADGGLAEDGRGGGEREDLGRGGLSSLNAHNTAIPPPVPPTQKRLLLYRT